jgi:hypothetical protein
MAGLPPAGVGERLVVLVTDAGGTPMAGARVAVSRDGKQVLRTQAGADGRALLFPEERCVEGELHHQSPLTRM